MNIRGKNKSQFFVEGSFGELEVRINGEAGMGSSLRRSSAKGTLSEAGRKKLIKALMKPGDMEWVIAFLIHENKA